MRAIKLIKKMKTRPVMFLWLVGFLSMGIIGLSSPAYAVQYTLNNWNVSQLNEIPRDYVTVDVGASGDNTTLTVQWFSGGGTGPTAMGIDQFLYNCSGCGPFDNGSIDESGDPGAIMQIRVGSIGGTDITAEWSTHFDGGHGDGFGYFSSRRNKDSAGTDGISQPLIFVLNGSDFSFTPNNSTQDGKEPGTFAAHVRYGNDCSGWVSDGNAGSSVEPDTNCGVKVPEPASLYLLGIGLIGLGLCKMRRFKAGS